MYLCVYVCMYVCAVQYLSGELESSMREGLVQRRELATLRDSGEAAVAEKNHMEGDLTQLRMVKVNLTQQLKEMESIKKK